MRDISVIQKSKVEKKGTVVAATSCCTPKVQGEACCTPSESKEENSGACCAQPADGSVCCNK